jgi:hypothetical protein
MRSPVRKSARLAVLSLEDRVVPAFNLAIDGDIVTAGVSSAFTAGTTTFTANANGATLDVNDIEAALGAGDVVITTGPTGAQAGNISWVWDSSEDDLDYADPTLRTLTIRPSASSTVGNIDTDFVAFTASDNLDVTIDTTLPATDGDITLGNDTQINSAHGVTLNAGTGNIAIASGSISPMTVSGNVVVTAGSFQNLDTTFVLDSTLGNVTFNAPIDMSQGSFSIRADDGTVTLNSPVDGANDITLFGRAVAINAPIGATIPLTGLVFAGGTVNFGANSITASAILVGAGVGDIFEASFGAGSGTVTGDVDVQSDGNLTPGGVGAIGTLNIVGSLTFDGGDYALDLGATSDKVIVNGDVNINFGNLGDPLVSTGALTGPANVKIIDLTGTLTGEFDNAPVGTDVSIGFDVIQVTSYDTPPGTGLTIAQVPGAPGGIVNGVDFDGTGYTIKLTGGGQLIVSIDAFNQINILTRATTIKSKVTITTKANASDDLIFLGPVQINGPLGAFNGSKTNLGGPFVAAGTVKALSFANALGPISLGGLATDKTTFKAETAFSTITTPGIVSSLSTSGDFDGSLDAAGVGKVSVGGTIFGFAPPWTVDNGVTSITAASIEGLDLTATFLGSLTAKGNVKKHISGDVNNSTIRLTGNDGSAKHYGLKTLTAKGNVFGTLFDVKEGNVGNVTVGRFLNSQLYLDYTPPATFDLPTGFDSTAVFTLSKFTTTATTLNDATNPLNWAFSGSEIAADTIGTVKLSGLKTDNAGVAFGLKFRSAGGSVQVKSVGPGTLPLNTNLTPSGTALAGDFFYLDV